MVEFDHTINGSEAKSYYLNLRDDLGHHFGQDFGLPHRAKVIIVDGEGRITYAQKHHKTQLWGSLKNWYFENHAGAGMNIHICFDSEEWRDGLPVLHIALKA